MMSTKSASFRRWAGGDNNRMRALAQELVGLQPDIILTNGIAATVTLQREARTIPIVFATGGDPVSLGLVASLNRPGANVTGIANLGGELAPKQLQLLREVVPNAAMFGVLAEPAFPPTHPSSQTCRRGGAR